MVSTYISFELTTKETAQKGFSVLLGRVEPQFCENPLFFLVDDFRLNNNINLKLAMLSDYQTKSLSIPIRIIHEFLTSQLISSPNSKVACSKYEVDDN